jgi:hypothetical protein
MDELFAWCNCLELQRNGADVVNSFNDVELVPGETG